MKIIKLTPRHWAMGWTVALSMAAFWLYYRALAPSIVTLFDDSLEFALVVHRLAIAHPTGYPLYTLLGKLMTLIDPSRTAYLLNLMSAFWAALTVGAMTMAGSALWPSDRTAHTLENSLGAGLGALLLAGGPVFFSQATVAEVYTLHTFFVALTLWLTLRRRWVWLALVLGLSMTHHRTTVLLLPGIAGWLALDIRLGTAGWWHRLQRDYPWGKIIVAGLLPLLLYLYLPLRGHIGTLEGTYQNSWGGFWSHIAGGGYSTFLLNNPLETERNPIFFLLRTVNELTWVGFGLSITGLALLVWQRQFKVVVLTGLVFIAYLLFNLAYAVSDIEVFLLPNFIILALWAGAALSWGLCWFSDKFSRGQWLSALVSVSLALLLLFNFRGESRANDWAVVDYANDIAATLPASATVVGIQGEVSLLRYLQEVEGRLPDLQTYRGDAETDRLAQVDAQLAAQPTRPLYLTRQLSGVAKRWSLSALGPLIQVLPTPLFERPPIEGPAEISVTPALTFAGYQLSRPAGHAPKAPLRLTLLWRVEETIADDWQVSARLLNSSGEVVAVVDAVPVHFAYPTSDWRPGEYIFDVYDLPLPDDLPPGQYQPLVIVYNPANNAAEVGQITLPPTYIP